mmetsp:Transcript_18516/g.32118  ORF Transcript_18516/g.32118 Transcript_18516/m.32118 type:complete len:286 (-) Transcript_18516:151-1008(-)
MRSSRKAAKSDASGTDSDLGVSASSCQSCRIFSIAPSRDCISFHCFSSSSCRSSPRHSCNSCSTARSRDCISCHFSVSWSRRVSPSSSSRHSRSIFSTASCRDCISCNLWANVARKADSSDASVSGVGAASAVSFASASGAGAASAVSSSSFIVVDPSPKVNKYSFPSAAAIVHWDPITLLPSLVLFGDASVAMRRTRASRNGSTSIVEPAMTHPTILGCGCFESLRIPAGAACACNALGCGVTVSALGGLEWIIKSACGPRPVGVRNNVGAGATARNAVVGCSP